MENNCRWCVSGAKCGYHYPSGNDLTKCPYPTQSMAEEKCHHYRDPSTMKIKKPYMYEDPITNTKRFRFVLDFGFNDILGKQEIEEIENILKEMKEKHG